MARLPARPTLLLLTPACDSSPAADDGADPDSLEFTAVDALQAVQVESEDASRYSVDVSALLHTGETGCRVFRGALSIDGCRHSEVVCKMGQGPRLVERIRKEAELYRSELKPLQGRYVPTFVGLFEGNMEGGETACLVLTYEGEPMQLSLYTSGIDFRCVLTSLSPRPRAHTRAVPPTLRAPRRKKLIAAMLALHKAGVQHGDFHERSIVLRASDNAPVLVGFGSADAHHACRLGCELTFYEPQPHSDAVRCTELYWASVVAAVWLPGARPLLSPARSLTLRPHLLPGAPFAPPFSSPPQRPSSSSTPACRSGGRSRARTRSSRARPRARTRTSPACTRSLPAKTSSSGSKSASCTTASRFP